MPESNTKKYQRDSGQSLYRRSLYTFWKRAAPPATLDVFNAPSRETACLRRERTNTPLQALSTLNDVQFIEAARHLAEVALRSSHDDTDLALQEIAQRVLARTLNPEETRVVKSTLDQFLAYYATHDSAAQKLASFGESQPDPSLPAARVAAFAMVANQLLNLDEALNK